MQALPDCLRCSQDDYFSPLSSKGFDVMRPKYSLCKRNGRLCVRESNTDWSEPRLIIHCWPTNQPADSIEDTDLADAQILYHGSPHYIYSIKARGAGYWLEARMPNGGQTESLGIEFEPVKAPRIGKGSEVRWSCGRWEKRTKTSGWKPV